jgi:hypothetical protein
MPARHRAPQPTVPNDTMLRFGLPLFAVGLIAVLLDVVPFLFGAHDRPLWINVVAVLALPTGLGLALFGLLRSARATPADIGTTEAETASTDAPGTAGTPGSATPATPARPAPTPRGSGRGRHARAFVGFQR